MTRPDFQPIHHANGSSADAISRRTFLGAAAAAAGQAWWRPSRGLAADEPLRLPPGRPASPVVRLRDPYAVNGPQAHRRLVAEMLERGLRALTGAADLKAAWGTILEPHDVLGLKFNRSGQEEIATTAALAETLVTSLQAAGWPPERIVCIEAPSDVVSRLGTQPAAQGFRAATTDFGSGADQLAAVLDQVTALVDVPFLKTHNLAGMTGALKNLSHGLTRHPARYHGHGCSPYIADIVALPAIREKLRLCVVDGLRVVFDGGPQARGEALSGEGVLMFSRDPVAIDAVGLHVLNQVRENRNLPPIAQPGRPPAFLADAHRAGLGTALWHGIEFIDLPP